MHLPPALVISSGGFSESKSSNSHLGELVLSLVISDGTNNDDSLASNLLGRVVLADLGEGHWGSVGSRMRKSSQNCLVEAGVGSSSEESEELDEQVLIKVGGPGVLLGRVLFSSVFD